MPKFEYAKKLMAPSGRWAILARLDENSPWVQVESVLGDQLSEDIVADLQNDETKRKEYIDDNEEEDWGKDAPVENV